MMKTSIKSLLGAVLVAALFAGFGCSAPEELSPVDYRAWVENPDNGLLAFRELGNYRFELQYRPKDYILLKENRGAVTDAATWEAEKQSLGDLQYYSFKISSLSGNASPLENELQAPEEYYHRLAYLSNAVQEDLSLVQNGDTLPCRMLHLERTYQLAPYSQLMLAFEAPPADQGDRKLVFRDRVFGTGIVQFTLAAADLARQPQIQLTPKS